MGIIKIVSPGREEDELKDQDRAGFYETGEVITAAVCDGVTTSTNQAEAAQYVVESVGQIFDQPDGLDKVVRELLKRREVLLTRKVDLNPDQESMRETWMAIARRKRGKSYQTTLIALRWRRDSRLKVHWIGCGDSAAFVFLPDGKLLWSSLEEIENEQTPLPHGAATLLLPDSCRNTRLSVSEELSFPRSACVLLCSDGFYDCFGAFSELFDWLRENYSLLKDPEQRVALMAGLHSRLNDTRGDDDISVVLSCPSFAESRDADSSTVDIDDQPMLDDKESGSEPLPELLWRVGQIKREFHRNREVTRRKIDQLSAIVATHQVDMQEMLRVQALFPQLQRDLESNARLILASNERYEKAETQVKESIENLQDQLRALASELLHELLQSRANLQGLQEQLVVLKQQVVDKATASWANHISTVLATFMADIEAIQQHLSSLQSRLDRDQEVMYANLEKMDEELARYLDQLREAGEQIQNDHQRMNADVESLRRASSAVNHEIVSIHTQFKILRDQVESGQVTVQHELDNLEMELAHYITEVQEVWRYLKDNKTMITDTQSELDKLELRLSDVERNLNKLRKDSKITRVLVVVCFVFLLVLSAFLVFDDGSNLENDVVASPTSDPASGTVPTITATTDLSVTSPITLQKKFDKEMESETLWRTF